MEIRTDSPMRRIADAATSGLALLALAPVFAVLALCVRLDSPGPVFFRQRRVGKDGVPFPILKFRTMVVDAERVGPKISGHRDSRVTRVGAVLRATKLDELPQLWNVFRGEMTLIGPRAEIPAMVTHYTAEERETLRVRPGLTGPGQVFFTTDQAGDLDGVADPEAHYVTHQLHPKLALDLDYLRNRTLATDVRVLASTARVLLGAIVGGGGR